MRMDGQHRKVHYELNTGRVQLPADGGGQARDRTEAHGDTGRPRGGRATRDRGAR